MREMGNTELAQVVCGKEIYYAPGNLGGDAWGTFDYDSGWADWSQPAEYGPMVSVEGGQMAVVPIHASDNSYINGVLTATVGRTAGVAASAFIEGALIGAGFTAWAGPAAILGGIVAGGAAAYGAKRILP